MGEWRETIYGRVAADFIEKPLKDLCDPDAGVQTGPFGSQLHQKDYMEVGTPIITVEHLGENRIIHSDVPRVSDKDRDRLSRYLLREGDIVFSRVGSVDRRALVRRSEDGWLFSGRCLRVRPDPKKIDSGFLSYFFGLPAFKQYIRAVAVGATMPSLNTGLLSEVIVPHPPSIEEQKAIAHILGTLDDKIELNRRMSETLEAMVRALFKAWFVNFDPVRAKMEGRWKRGQSLPGLPVHLYDLFPDRLVESELGEIPDGWSIETLADHFDAVKGISYKGSGLSESGIPLHNLNSIYEGGGYKYEGIKYYAGEYKERHLVSPGDVIVANTEQGHDRLLIGYAAIIPSLFGEFGIFSHHLYRLRPKSNTYLTTAYLCHLLNSARMHDVVSGYANGTTVNMLPIDGVQMPKIVCPPPQLVKLFDSLASESEHRREELVLESRTLADLRDVLLPKLISGELRVKDAERIIGGIT